ncbi:MCE family protein [Roseateles sp. DAIF2]|uniref:MlaD family protein n=1 Tax=Roseateles sp. DAIF2 TaxID=2714952 RepID=UPI0018A2C6C1|nr:MlaD family protein [Roseateles sp. DAIF2]QPF74089.1 MCE family protein [Roseateles sp. DAIF2]
MSRRGNATLIGAFVVLGLILATAAVIVIGGGEIFARRERVVMHFSGSIYGLQVGAPVVFRGVRLGNVSSISVAYDKQRDEFSIPVLADIETEAIRGLANGKTGVPILPGLVERGLRAQLSMQSLLTGQLYVDLDLRPDKQPRLRNAAEGPLEIPTVDTPIQEIKNQIDGLDIRRLVDDVSTIAATARGIVTDQQVRQSLSDVAASVSNLRRFSEQLDRRFGPLADSATRTSDKLGQAADSINDTAQRFSGTAQRANALLAPDSPLVRGLQQTSEQLSQLALSLRQQTDAESPLVLQLDNTLRDVSRAARALRELAELLDRRPDALLRGRQAPPADATVAPPTNPAKEKAP